MPLANPLLRPCNRHISMRISSPTPAPNPKFRPLHRSPPPLRRLVDNAPALRGPQQKISHPMFDPKLSPTFHLMFNLLHRRPQSPVHRRAAPAAVVADVDAVAVAANKPSRKPSHPPPLKDRSRHLHSKQQN